MNQPLNPSSSLQWALTLKEGDLLSYIPPIHPLSILWAMPMGLRPTSDDPTLYPIDPIILLIINIEIETYFPKDLTPPHININSSNPMIIISAIDDNNYHLLHIADHLQIPHLFSQDPSLLDSTFQPLSQLSISLKKIEF